MKVYRFKALSDKCFDERQHGQITWNEFKRKMKKLLKKAKGK